MSDIRASDREPATIDYLGAVRRRWWIVVLGIILGIAGGLGVAAVQTKVYDASASVLVQDTGAPSTGQVANARTNSGINLDTESQVVQSQVVASKAQSILKTKTPTAQLVSNVSVTVPPNSSVLAIAYSAPTAKAAQQGARAFAQAYLANRGDQAQKQVTGQIAALQAQRAALDKQLSDASGQIASLPTTSVQRQQAEASRGILSNQLSTIGGQLTTLSSADITPGSILTDAALPTSPSSPNKLLDLGGGLLAGLLLGLIVAFVVERSDRHIYSADDAGRRAGLPLLASLPRKRFPNRLVAPGDAAAAHMGRLRNALVALLADRGMLDAGGEVGPRTVVVCGGRADDANGVVAANVAAAVAASGYPVTLVCADRSSSSLALLGVSAQHPGLTEVLHGARLRDVARPSTQPGLSVIGPGADQPASLDRGLDLLRRGTDDSEAILMFEVPFAQAELLSRRADVTLAVVVLRRSTRTLVADMGAGLDRNRSRLVVLSQVKGRVTAAPDADAAAPVDDVSPARASVAGAGQSSRR